MADGPHPNVLPLVGALCGRQSEVNARHRQDLKDGTECESVGALLKINQIRSRATISAN
jgi:hypothetical protein